MGARINVRLVDLLTESVDLDGLVLRAFKMANILLSRPVFSWKTRRRHSSLSDKIKEGLSFPCSLPPLDHHACIATASSLWQNSCSARSRRNFVYQMHQRLRTTSWIYTHPTSLSSVQIPCGNHKNWSTGRHSTRLNLSFWPSSGDMFGFEDVYYLLLIIKFIFCPWFVGQYQLMLAMQTSRFNVTYTAVSCERL